MSAAHGINSDLKPDRTSLVLRLELVITKPCMDSRGGYVNAQAYSSQTTLGFDTRGVF